MATTKTPKLKPKRLEPQQVTWVMRKLGPAFDHDTTCEYTSLRLYRFPLGDRLIGYHREDGCLRACRVMSEDEQAGISPNFETFELERAEYDLLYNPNQTRKTRR